MDFGLTHRQEELFGKGKTSDHTKIENIKVSIICIAIFILIG